MWLTSHSIYPNHHLGSTLLWKSKSQNEHSSVVINIYLQEIASSIPTPYVVLQKKIYGSLKIEKDG